MNNLKRIKEVLDLDEWRKRQKTEFRKRVDEFVKNYEPVKHAHKEYLLFRDTIQSTENML